MSNTTPWSHFIFSPDFAKLGEVIEMLNESEAVWIHLDVMDGRFVSNISFAFPVIEAIKPLAQKSWICT